jgi:hypothetical protein
MATYRRHSPRRRGIQQSPNYRETKAVPNWIGGEYRMPAFAGMTTTDLKILGENK